MNQLGEVWIEKSNRATSYEAVVGGRVNYIEENETLFSKVKTSGFNNQTFINTGLLGFLKAPDNDEETPNLFIIGRREEIVNVRGMCFQPQEIESSILRSHRYDNMLA